MTAGATNLLRDRWRAFAKHYVATRRRGGLVTARGIDLHHRSERGESTRLFSREMDKVGFTPRL